MLVADAIFAAIARDLGDMLGCLGHVTELRRTWSGPFDLEDAVSLDAVAARAGDPALDELLLPLQVALGDLPELPCSAEGAVRLRNGNPGRVLSSEAEYGDEAWASYMGQPLAVGIYRAGELHPSRVFNLG